MAEQNKGQQKEQDLNHLLQVRRDKLKELQENGKDPFKITKYDVTHHSMEIKDHYEELEGQTVTIAGRMMFKRVMGKASFCNIQDLQGSIQSYVARDSIGEESYKDFKSLKQRPERYPFTQAKSFCLARAFRCFLKNSMG